MAVIKENNGDASVDTETQYTLSPGDVFQGTLASDTDEDWIRLSLTAETTWNITLTGVDAAYLALYDDSGEEIIDSFSCSDGVALVYRPIVTGTYYVSVTVWQGVGDYEIALTENTLPEGTHDEIADYLTDGYWSWSGGGRNAFEMGPGRTLSANTTALTAAGQQLAKLALDAWTNVTGITFEFVDDDTAHITFDDNEAGGHAVTTASNGVIEAAHVNVSSDWLLEYGTGIESYSFHTYIHEIGHALGLGHAGPYNGFGSYGLDNVFLNDSHQATVMSYFDQDQNTYIDVSGASPVTPMIADIIAIQNLYSVPDNINTGDTIYGYQSNLDGYLGEFFKLWAGEENPFTSVDMTDDTGTPIIKPTLTDLDGDGDPDLVVGAYDGSLYYFENSGTPTNPDFTERTGTDNPLEGISVWFYSAPTFTDLDGDGDLDLIVGTGDDDITYFENTGTVTAPGFTQRTGAANPFDTLTKSQWSTLTLADLDGDDDLDLAVGNDDGDCPLL